MIIKKITRQETATKTIGSQNSRSVNWPLVFATTLLLVVISTAVYFWHQRQQAVVAQAFLDRAEELEGADDYRGASQYLMRYLKLHPDDAVARIRLAKDYHKTAATRASWSNAIELYYRAIGFASAEQVSDLRPELTELLIKSNRYSEAIAEANATISGFPTLRSLEAIKETAKGQELPEELAAGWRHLAIASYAQLQLGITGQDNDSSQQQKVSTVTKGEILEAAILVNPTDLSLPVMLASIYRRFPENLSKSQKSTDDLANAADAVVDQMVERNSGNPKALVARMKYRAEKQVVQSEGDLLRALKLAPNDVATVLFAAQFYQARGRELRAKGRPDSEVSAELLKSLDHYLSIIEELDGKNRLAFEGASAVQVLLGNSEQAVKLMEEGLKQVPSSKLLHLGLAEQHLQFGRAEAASRSIRALQALINRMPVGNLQAFWERELDLVRAVKSLVDGDWARSLATAESIVNDPVSSIDLRSKSWTLITRLQQNAGRWDLAAKALEQQIAIDRDNLPLYLLAARAWQNAGQPEKSLLNLERVRSTSAEFNRSEIALQIAKSQMACVLRNPVSERDWKKFDSELASLEDEQAVHPLKFPWQLNLLRADYAAIRLDDDKAMEAQLSELVKAENDHPSDWDLARELVIRYDKLGKATEADRVLAKCRKLNDTVENDFLEARLLFGRGRLQDARDKMLEIKPGLPVQQQVAVNAMLAQLSYQQGDLASAADQLATIAKASQSPVQYQELAFLWLELGDFEAAEKVEQKLLELEGQKGTAWRVIQASRKLALAERESDRKSQDRLLHEAKMLATSLKSKRPNWHKTYDLAGQLENMLGNRSQAIQDFQRSVELGGANTRTYQLLAELLYRDGRPAEAMDFLRGLENVIPKSDTLSSLAINLATNTKDLDLAVVYAKKRVEFRPDDPFAHTWYAETLRMTDQIPLAEEQFEQARKLAPDNLAVWTSFFQFQLATGQKKAAEKTLEYITAKCIFPEENLRDFVLAQAFEALGQNTKASEHYQKAAEANPDNVPIQTRLMKFVAQNSPAETEDSLRRLLKLTRGSRRYQTLHGNTRRMLATLLAKRAGPGDFEAAKSLLSESSEETDHISVFDKRLRAVLYVKRQPPEFSEAQRIMEQVVLRGEPESSDYILLGWILYLKCQQLRQKAELTLEDNALAECIREAKRYFESGCKDARASVPQFSVMLKFLLEFEQWSSAEVWIDRLRGRAPQDIAWVVWKYRLLKTQSKPYQTIPSEFAQELEIAKLAPLERAKLLSQLAQSFSKSKEHATAIECYQLANELSPKFNLDLAYAMFRWSQAAPKNTDKLKEAFALVVTEVETTPENKKPLMVLLAMLLSSQTDSATVPRASNVIAKGLANHPQDLEVLINVGNLRVTEHRSEDAKALYAKALQIDAENIIALNNLATLKGENPSECNEALALIDKAINLAGPNPALLDTKGVVLLQLGRTDEAIMFLREATKNQQNDPRHFLHLAAALHRRGDVAPAMAQLAIAKNNDLPVTLLTNSDLQLLKQLESAATQN